MVIKVKDEGMGISNQVKNAILNCDWQNLQYTRLSLYTCVKLIHHLGGDLQVSTKEQVGSIFLVLLPFE